MIYREIWGTILPSGNTEKNKLNAKNRYDTIDNGIDI